MGATKILDAYRHLVIFLILASLSACKLPGSFPDQESLCDFDQQRENERLLSAQSFDQPVITKMLVNGVQVWEQGSGVIPSLSPGDLVELRGQHFGNGVDTDFSKVMIGNSRILETDLKMYKQILAIGDQVNYEIPETHDTWDKDVVDWNENRIQFTVPVHVSEGPLVVQVQKRTGYLESLTHPGQPHNVIDAQSSRIIDENEQFEYECDVVSTLSAVKSTAPFAVKIRNPNFDALVKQGREVFWSYDYNIGTAHSVRKLDWSAIFEGKSKDPIADGKATDLEKLFGAYLTKADEVPAEAIEDVYFAPYPMPNPIPGLLNTQDPLYEGNTRNSGYVGYRYAEANEPFKGKGEWIGFNCASCHGYRLSYEKSPGYQVTKVIPGLPNPKWSMKWTVLQTTLNKFEGIYAKEEGPSWMTGNKDIAKDMLLYYMPQGAGEHNIVRMVGEGSHTDNDYQFSPIAIPNVTNYMAIRRSLSHTESYVGFEGSYIHSEEPDGAMGSMKADALKALTAYMTVLDEDDQDLISAGLYRWLKERNKLDSQSGSTNVSEGQFVQTGWQSYPGVVAAVESGKQTFNHQCADCHSDALGAYTNEKMIRLDEVGRFFTPTIYQKEVQSIRTTFLRNMYWVQHRGLLSDGHVRNLTDLVHPDRCNVSSSLYKNYYTLHEPVVPALGGLDHPEPYPATNRKGDVFRVPKSDYKTKLEKGYKRNLFIERHKYFVEVPWDADHYYWDYQKMRSEYGPDEMGTPEPIGMPDAPHPWCAQSVGEVDNLVQYILTL